MTLREQIDQRSEAEVREAYARHLEDWADTDTAVRTLAKTVLSESEVEGDSHGVPGIEDIVERLISKIRNKA